MAAYISELQERGVRVIASRLDATTELWDVDMTGPVALLVGNEARGLPEAEAAVCDVQVRIPILGKAESLNVAEATSVMLYELVRQRRAADGGGA
jgi:tRNA G18 (ribose-2'-O)-methylase SpoU